MCLLFFFGFGSNVARTQCSGFSVDITNQSLSSIFPGGGTWSSGTVVKVTGTLTMDQSINLSNVTFLMNANASIMVQGTGTIVRTSSGTTFEGCDYMWNGITARNGGAVQMTSSFVKDAKIALTFLPTANVGSSTLRSNNFQNNQIGLVAPGFSPGTPFRLLDFSANNFTKTVADLKYISTNLSERPRALRGLQFSSSTVDISTNVAVRNTVDQFLYGIWASNSDVQVANFTFDNQATSAFYSESGTGIYAERSRLTVGGFGATGCVFTDNAASGIVSSSTRQLLVFGGTFTDNQRYGIRAINNSFMNPSIHIFLNTLNVPHHGVSAIFIQRPAGSDLDGGPLDENTLIETNDITFSETSPLAKRDKVLIDVLGLLPATDGLGIATNTLEVNGYTPTSYLNRFVHGIRVVGMGDNYAVTSGNSLNYASAGFTSSAESRRSIGIIMEDLTGTGHFVRNNTVTGAGTTTADFLQEGIRGNNISGLAFFCENVPSECVIGMRMSAGLNFTKLVENQIGSARVGLQCRSVLGGLTSMPDQDRHENVWTGSYVTLGAQYADGAPTFDILFDDDNIIPNDGPPAVSSTAGWFFPEDGSNPVCGRGGTVGEGLSQQETDVVENTWAAAGIVEEWDTHRRLVYKLLRFPYIAENDSHVEDYLNNQEGSSAYQFAYAQWLFDEAFALDSLQADEMSGLNADLKDLWLSNTELWGLQDTGYNETAAAQQADLFEDMYPIRAELDSLQNEYWGATSESLATALTYAQGLPDTATFESNLNTTAIRHASGDSLTGNDYDLLREVASQCPQIGGLSVRIAPLWLPHEEAVWYACDSLAEDCLASPKLLSAAQTSQSPLGKVSPNPASDLLQIVAPVGASTGLVQVRDINGHLLETRNWHKASEVFVLKTAGWKAGIYSVSFQTDNGTSTTRIVISN